MSSLDTLFKAIFNLSGTSRQSALLEKGDQLISLLFFVMKNRTLLGTENVTVREKTEELQVTLEWLLDAYATAEISVRHQSLFLNGCLLPRGELGHDEGHAYLVSALEEKAVEELRFTRVPSGNVLRSVLELVETLPRAWPSTGAIEGPGFHLSRLATGDDAHAPVDIKSRGAWVYLSLLDARGALESSDEPSLRSGLRFARWFLHELIEMSELHPRLVLSLTHLRRQDRFRFHPAVRDVNTAIVALMMGQSLGVTRSEALKLAFGGLLHRWAPQTDHDEVSNPALTSATVMLRAGGINPFNFSLMVLLNGRYEEERNLSMEIVELAARFEDLLHREECTVATALHSMLSDPELYQRDVARLLVNVWGEHGRG